MKKCNQKGDKVKNAMYALISFSLAMILWMIISSPSLKSGKVFASPLEVLKAFFVKAESGQIWRHILSSAYRAIVGFLLAFVSSIPAAFMMGWYNPFRKIFEPWIRFVKCIPPIAFISLVVVGAGVGEKSKIIVIFISSFLVSVITIYSGVMNVDNTLIKAAKVLGSNDLEIFYRVVVPASTPYILVAARLGLSAALTTLIAAELTGAQVGLGQMIQEASNYFKMDVVLMGIILIGIIGVSFEKIISILEKRLTAWQEVRKI